MVGLRHILFTSALSFSAAAFSRVLSRQRSARNQTEPISLAMGMNYGKMFLSFFEQEFRLRDNLGAPHGVPSEAMNARSQRKATDGYLRPVRTCASYLYMYAAERKLPARNLAFIFLDRYYPWYGPSHRSPASHILLHWESFSQIELPREPQLLALLGYDDMRRKVCTSVIREMLETKKAKTFKTFLKERCGGFVVKYPAHFGERTRLFETVLRLLADLEKEKLTWFVQAHASEMLKAHVLYLKRYGNPVELKLGNLHGDQAMWRLREYQRLTDVQRSISAHKPVVVS